MACATDNSDVPFRLLGFAADPDKASNLCGGTFARYAAAGTEVTPVCAAAHEWSSVDRMAGRRPLGCGKPVPLDFPIGQRGAPAHEGGSADGMQSAGAPVGWAVGPPTRG